MGGASSAAPFGSRAAWRLNFIADLTAAGADALAAALLAGPYTNVGTAVVDGAGPNAGCSLGPMSRPSPGFTTSIASGKLRAAAAAVAPPAALLDVPQMLPKVAG